jgi:LuxR family maltose regulon positive regulatory protein
MTEMARQARRAYELESDQGIWRPLSCLLLGVAAHLSGEHETALRRLEEGVDAAGGDAPDVAVLCLAQAGIVAFDQTDWDRAGELADRATALAECDERPGTALVWAVAAATRTHLDRLDDAKRDLVRGLHLLGARDRDLPWCAAQTRIMLARAAVGLSDTVRARELLAEASRFARKVPDAIVFPQWLDTAWEHVDTVAETALCGPETLTIAELRILRFMPSHRSFREIGQLLGVSVNTVKSQAHAVYRKLGASSRSEAVGNATRVGLLGG